MTVLGWVALGLVAGFLASKIYRNTASSLALEFTLGVVGAIAGGLAFEWLGFPQVTAFVVAGSFGAAEHAGTVDTALVLAGSFGAVAGSVATLAGYRVIFRHA